MLRFFVLLLLLANGAYFAWSQGWLQVMGWAPPPAGEPARLQQQVQPGKVDIRRAPPAVQPHADAPDAPLSSGQNGAGDVAAAALPGLLPVAVAMQAPEDALPAPQPAAAVPEPDTQCLVAGPYDQAQTTRLRKALAALPAKSWRLLPEADAAPPGRWLVYMGKYPDAQAMEAKRAELKLMDVALQPVTHPALKPGLALGYHDSRAAAEAALKNLRPLGIRTAKVVQEPSAPPRYTLRLPKADQALRERVLALKGTPLAGKPLKTCA